MKHNSPFRIALAALTLCGVLWSSVVIARAQDTGGSQTVTPPLRIGGIAAFNPFGGMQGDSHLTPDPTRSNALDLLKRKDVYNEIAIDDRQRDALNSLPDQLQANLRAQLRAGFQQGRGQDLSSEDRRAQIREQMQNAFQTYQNEMDRRMAAILRPNQMRRLRELDLQWRSALALVDPKVAEKMEVTPDQKAKIDPIFQEFRNAQYAAFRPIFAAMGRRSPLRSESGPPPEQEKPATPEQLKQQVVAAQKEVAKAQKAADEKVLALLTPEQKERWKSMLGTRFTFRVYEE